MKKHILLPFLAILLLDIAINNTLYGQCNSTPCTVPTPSVNAQDACILPGPSSLDCYYGATTFDAPVSFPPSWCTTIENNHFFAFTADAPTAIFDICAISCSFGAGVQAALLATNDCINFSFVSPCLGNITYGDCQQLVATQLNPGEVYYLMIDGIAGAVCDYSINGVIPTATGPTDGLCLPNASATYTASSSSSWTIHPPTAGTIQGNPIGTSVNIVWAEAGTAEVCAHPLTCPNAPDFCLPVRIGVDVESTEEVALCENYSVTCAGQVFTNPGIYTVHLPSYSGCDSVVNCIVHLIPTPVSTQTLEICPGGTGHCAGEEFLVPGNFVVTLNSWQGCDSVVHCQINLIPNLVTNLGTRYVCQGSCLQYADSLYCNPGSYTRKFTSYQGCDSIVTFNLQVIPIQNSAAIQAPQGQTITCLHPSLLLESQNIPLISHIWKNLGGDTLGTDYSITVNNPGVYFHETKGTLAGTNCTDQAKILIKENTSPPPVTAMGGQLDAAHPTVQLMGNSIISGVTYHWEGPNGFSSNLKKPVVSTPGFYTLTVTNPLTGCTNSITVEVTIML